MLLLVPNKQQKKQAEEHPQYRRDKGNHVWYDVDRKALCFSDFVLGSLDTRTLRTRLPYQTVAQIHRHLLSVDDVGKAIEKSAMSSTQTVRLLTLSKIQESLSFPNDKPLINLITNEFCFDNPSLDPPIFIPNAAGLKQESFTTSPVWSSVLRGVCVVRASSPGVEHVNVVHGCVFGFHEKSGSNHRLIVFPAHVCRETATGGDRHSSLSFTCDGEEWSVESSKVFFSSDTVSSNSEFGAILAPKHFVHSVASLTKLVPVYQKLRDRTYLLDRRVAMRSDKCCPGELVDNTAIFGTLISTINTSDGDCGCPIYGWISNLKKEVVIGFHAWGHDDKTTNSHLSIYQLFAFLQIVPFLPEEVKNCLSPLGGGV